MTNCVCINDGHGEYLLRPVCLVKPCHTYPYGAVPLCRDIQHYPSRLLPFMQDRRDRDGH